ncbi:hypothetical protein AS156_32950 [Bradyrhizobium macuxiense]|uniref:Uncharacterized protein n=1 Tax=Bradyrhizobium macuxiense TaxID=1755647 RepID=A0A109K1M4_9BRAD|nr:hypothetical protein AS156_32950 [Bradyrhizobium macuxiense]
MLTTTVGKLGVRTFARAIGFRVELMSDWTRALTRWGRSIRRPRSSIRDGMRRGIALSLRLPTSRIELRDVASRRR